MRTRVLIGAPGVLLGLYGVFRLVTQIDGYDLLVLFAWLVGALVVHDGILSPAVAAAGVGIARFVPPRGRRFLQGGLIAAALITVVALSMIYRAHSQPRIKAILEQNFAANLGILVLIVAVGAVLLYVAAVLRQARSATKSRPAADHDSTTE
jgi:hypothetical protein